ncbi:frataxin homolog, mitochondrial [Sabethes cyaneus]|uniref:frataxin homolog, mitochondrial n=1 Tax=Sabethes cyaneus TaxID=53552 RepID=UPI00237D7373|nr:frataxin homolog, mitochondrial [Sabethes cyaneus]
MQLVAIRNILVRINTIRNIRLASLLTYEHCANHASNNYQLCCKRLSIKQQAICGHLFGTVRVHKQTRNASSMNPNDFIATSLIDSVTFESVCSETLESLCDYMEKLVEETSFLKSADVTYGDGVLTVNFGEPYGTYVINRQSPNRQIWLSSPTSGPKRYDFIPDKSIINKGCWVYKHDGISLHELLQKELREIVQRDVEFLSLPHSQRSSN